MVLEKFFYTLGATKENRKELSNKLYDNAIVSGKQYIEDTVDEYLALGYALEDPAMGYAIGEEARYLIKFDGEKTSFIIDDEGIFDFVEIGEEVILGYKEIYQSTYDYLPPNFNKKQRIKKEILDYELINVKRHT